MVIQKAWRQKITFGGKPLYFDRDYTAVVPQQRKAYANIKKALKQKGIRFQTAFTKMRIHWDSGVQVYDSAWAAARELRQQGIDMEMPTGPPDRGEQLQRSAPWKRVGPYTGADMVGRTKERLRQFQRQQPE